VEAFTSDRSPDAWEKLVDRLLASPRYGERQGRRWLDLVRYAESDGWRQDAYRPHAWPYRDWVIAAFNADKAYDRFLKEQLAGDEIDRNDPELLTATGFLRLGTYEYNQRNAPAQRADILNEVTDVTADVFLGLGMGCARCHDHKFDPLLQRDYYSLQAFFAGTVWRDDLVRATPAEQSAYDAKLRAWEAKTAELRAKIDEIERPYLASLDKNILEKFLPEFTAMWSKPAAERSAYEHQVADLVQRQVIAERALIDGKIKGEKREQWSALKRKLSEFDAEKPKPLAPAFAVTDVGPEAAPSKIPHGPVTPPAWLEVLGGGAPRPKATAQSTGRRLALAEWIADPAHPLTARVMANRIWQQHFGKGLVATANDFGRLGEKPSHPELLDWLAREFVAGGWSVKKLHRTLMTTAAYRRASTHPDSAAARLKDPENRLLWKMPVRRLESEEIRDAMLATSGELDLAAGGPAVDVNLPRRSVYTKAQRNLRDPLLDAFDLPDSFASVPSRNTTTTAVQALLMINGRWPLERAAGFAKRLRASADPVGDAYRTAYGRPPTPAEREAAKAFLAKSAPAAAAPADLPLVQTMPDRGGIAARIRSGVPGDRLRLPAALTGASFTVEAVVLLDSIFEDASVRVIASKWDGNPQHPGWSLGVTSAKSKHAPRNVILQLGAEVVASDLRLELHKTHYVGVSVVLGETATFYLLDLSDPEATLRTATIKVKTGPSDMPTALVIGGRDLQSNHGWDGLIDELRISKSALPREQLLIGDAPATTVSGYWKFEADTGFFADSAGLNPPLGRPAAAKSAVSESGLVDFCHVILNSNEFLHVD
jgi:hypothetical protein